MVRRQRRVNGIAERENSSGKHEGFLCSVYGRKKEKNFRGRMREEIFRKLFLENILSFDRTNERMKVNGRRNFFQMLNTSQDSI